MTLSKLFFFSESPILNMYVWWRLKVGQEYVSEDSGMSARSEKGALGSWAPWALHERVELVQSSLYEVSTQDILLTDRVFC